MALRRRGSNAEGLNAWPGYVDALSTLLMVIIFVLLVFVLAQGFLSVALSGRQQALEKLNRQVAELSDMLGLERGRSAELGLSLAQARHDLEVADTARDRLSTQLAAAQQELQADKATAEARVADLARLAEQVRALTALRDDLEKQAGEAAARAITEAQARAAAATAAEEEKRLGDTARAQLALLSRQMDEMRAQLAGLQKALDLAELSAQDKDAQIANLGSQLNAALARKVEELQRYRSDFFGRLREVLANRPGIQVVGDRFVFQSEVLFPVGSADLSNAGAEQILKLADTLKQISKQIPKNISWILRVDGHADRQRVDSGPWGSNWELSAGRAITVVKLLIADGIPPNRLAATGFGDNQPLDPANTPEAYARNRRIEIRLTDR
jgi:chemotaxis protein MotB